MRSLPALLWAALVASACATTSAPPAPLATPDPAVVQSDATTTERADGPGGALVVWARGDLTASFAAEVATLPRVLAAAHVRRATLGLTATRSADGEQLESYPDGFRIPVDVAALDPAAYAPTLADTTAAEALDLLAPGAVLLTRGAAELRGATVGDRVDVGGATDLRIVALIEDGTVGRSEIVAHLADAEVLGLEEDGTVFIRHDAASGAETAALVEAIDARVPADVTARIVDVRAPDERRRAPLVLSLAQVKARFGEFAFRPRPGERGVDLAPGFVEQHISDADVPLLGGVRCHTDILADLRAALTAVIDAGLADEIDPARYAGCFNPRRISATSDRLSHHAWGIALDINVDLSAPNGGEVPHPGVIAAFEDHGFRWGGDFLVPDNHHFEWVGRARADDPSSGRVQRRSHERTRPRPCTARGNSCHPPGCCPLRTPETRSRSTP